MDEMTRSILLNVSRKLTLIERRMAAIETALTISVPKRQIRKSEEINEYIERQFGTPPAPPGTD